MASRWRENKFAQLIASAATAIIMIVIFFRGC